MTTRSTYGFDQFAHESSPDVKWAGCHTARGSACHEPTGGYTARERNLNQAQQQAHKKGKHSSRGLAVATQHDNKQPTLRIPTVNGDKENDDDGLLSPRRMLAGVQAFASMADAGAGWGSALVATLQGHKMTEEQAAICLQSHWRRHEALVTSIARTMAAVKIQTAAHLYLEKQWLQEDAELHAALDDHIETDSAATMINACWRGHLSRRYVRNLRKEKEGRLGSLRRSFSFSKKKKKPTAGSPPGSSATPSKRSAGNTPPGRAANTPAERSQSLAKRVRRSLSFDLKKRRSIGDDDVEMGEAKVNVGVQRRQFVLERGPAGLGLLLDKTNTVVGLKEGGKAEEQGLLQEGDTILSIDGRSCAGVLLQDVIPAGKPAYVVEVSRPTFETPARPKVPPLNTKLIKRSVSFDRFEKKGIKRSASFDRFNKKSSGVLPSFRKQH